MATTLLIIDLQNDYFPGGRNPLVDSVTAAKQARRLLDAFRVNSQPVVHVQHLATRPGATFFIHGTSGAEIYPLVQPQAGEAIIQKHYPNSFRETALLDTLHNLDTRRLVVTGMMTHMCLDAGVRAAADFGFECWVAGDACATKDLAYGGLSVPALQVHTSFLAALAAAYAKVMQVEEILADPTLFD